MSTDIVDDLHAAEEKIGYLQHVLQRVADGTNDDTWGDEIDAALAPYCRPSCEDHDHDDPTDLDAEDCGCPGHREVA